MVKQEELGNRRQDTLPLDDREAYNRPAYQPSRAKVAQNADSIRLSTKWKGELVHYSFFKNPCGVLFLTYIYR